MYISCLLFGLFYGCGNDAIEAKQDTVEEVVETEEEEVAAEPTLVCPESFGQQPEGALDWAPVVENEEPIEAQFELAIDVNHTAFSEEGFQAREEAVTITSQTADWDVVAAAKHLQLYPDIIRLDIFVAPPASGMRDVVLAIDSSSSTIYDYRTDPWAPATSERQFAFSHVNERGYIQLSIGLEKSDNISLSFTVTGIQSSAEARSSSTIALSHDDDMLWSTFADGDVLTATKLSDGSQTSFSIPGWPNTVDVTPDNRYALSASAKCNQLVVIDTQSMEIVQRFGEDDGVAREPRHLVITPDGTRAYVSSYVGDKITVLKRVEQGFVIENSVDVGRRPTGLSVSPDGNWLYVAHFLPRGPIQTNESWMSAINTQTLQIENEVAFADQFNIDRAECVKDIEIFSTWEAEDLSFEGVPKMLTGVFMHPNGQYALLPGLKSPGFPALEGDLSSWGIGQTRKGANNPAVLYPVNFSHSPMGQNMPWQLAQDVTDTTEEFLRCAQPTNDIEYVTPREAGVLGEEREELYFYPGTITPGRQTPMMPMGAIGSMAYSKGGRRIFALSHVADMLSVIDAATLQPASIDHFVLSGANPTGIVFRQDGTKAYVAYRNSTFVSVLDTSAYAQPELPKPLFTPYWLQDTSQVTVSLATRKTFTRDIRTLQQQPNLSEEATITIAESDPMDPIMRRGKILFESSNPDKYPGLSGHPHASCVSCHPDGASDGSAWGTVEGERRSNSLRGGVAGRGWLHYSATHANIPEFLEVVIPERLGGAGLSEEDMHALSNYIAFGIPTIQGPKVDQELAQQGEELFANNCASCHMGETYSSGNPDPAEPYGGASHDRDPFLYDIATGTDNAGVILGAPFAAIFPEPAGSLLLLLGGDRDLGEGDIVEDILAFEPRPSRAAGLFKAPSLTNIWDEALLLHDGSITNLPDLVQYKSQHFSLSFSAAEEEALVAYLQTL